MNEDLFQEGNLVLDLQYLLINIKLYLFDNLGLSCS